ncbi:histone acetyltransferase HPA2 and related acetyltransferase [Vibrio cholerae]|nr:histone acetyltransferase HPA2 and related acetyltransferase [Vibrio cholerae]
MKVIEASVSNLDDIAILFDAYRQFYEQESDIQGARNFIEMHMKNGDSVIFLALSEGNEPLGFAQLYPSFSSVAMKCIFRSIPISHFGIIRSPISV